MSENGEDSLAQTVISGWIFETCGDAPDGLSVTPIVTRYDSGPYEVTEITFGFSGNAAYYTQIFSATFSCSVSVPANGYSVTVSSDDTATVVVGEISASSTLQNSAFAQTETWIDEPPASLAISGAFSTIGGPYSLSVTIVLKESLRKLYFETEVNTPDEIDAAAEMDETAAEEFLAARRVARTSFGCAENVYIRVRDKRRDDEIIALTDSVPADCSGSAEKITTADGGNEFTARTKLLAENVGNAAGEDSRRVSVIFGDGEELTADYTVKFPEYESATELTAEEFAALKIAAGSSVDFIDYKDWPYRDGHYFLVTVHPTDVSFVHLYFWENECSETKTGLFLLPDAYTTHEPSDPVQLDIRNRWTDKAYYSASFSFDEVKSVEPDEDGNVGTLTWLCPVRWSTEKPEKESGATNASLTSDGNVPARTQITTLTPTGEESPALTVKVFKTFSS